jgi:hypothetical protein
LSHALLTGFNAFDLAGTVFGHEIAIAWNLLSADIPRHSRRNLSVLT